MSIFATTDKHWNTIDAVILISVLIVIKYILILKTEVYVSLTFALITAVYIVC